ncbi:MAG: hypothetical protein JSV43_06480 [Methanobacteriota archaeon]|nr:MAG: hypothetical protein JSV43_06480 [Euryarchaeota archaeon]
MSNLTRDEKGCLIIWLTKVMPPHSLKIFEAFISIEEPYLGNRKIVRSRVPTGEQNRFDMGEMTYTEIKKTIPGISDGSLREGLRFLEQKGFLIHERKLYRISDDPNLHAALRNIAQLATKLYGIEDEEFPTIEFYPIIIEDEVVRLTTKYVSLERGLAQYSATLARGNTVIGRIWNLSKEQEDSGKLGFSDDDNSRTLSARDTFFSLALDPGPYRLDIIFKGDEIASVEWSLDQEGLKNEPEEIED